MKEVGLLVPDGDGRAALLALAKSELVLLDDGGESIEGAYPMTTATTPHCLTVEGHEVHAMCALDALGVSPMFGVKTIIESRCHITGERIRVEQLNQEVLEASPSSHINVGIRWHSGDVAAAHSL
jgi:mercuric reductase